jgi:hypothetical protein
MKIGSDPLQSDAPSASVAKAHKASAVEPKHVKVDGVDVVVQVLPKRAARGSRKAQVSGSVSRVTGDSVHVKPDTRPVHAPVDPSLAPALRLVALRNYLSGRPFRGTSVVHNVKHHRGHNNPPARSTRLPASSGTEGLGRM